MNLCVGTRLPADPLSHRSEYVSPNASPSCSSDKTGWQITFFSEIILLFSTYCCWVGRSPFCFLASLFSTGAPRYTVCLLVFFVDWSACNCCCRTLSHHRRIYSIEVRIVVVVVVVVESSGL